MRRGWILSCAVAVALAGCGGDEERPATAPEAVTSDLVTGTVPSPTPQELERTFTTNQPPPYVPPAGEPIGGRRLVAALGCLACHQIGARGNSGPGDNLAGIGTRRTPAQIRHSLLDAPAPMPSYRALARSRLDALVAYLSSLRGDCPDGSDCG